MNDSNGNNDKQRRNTPEEILEIVKAYIEGRRIEFRTARYSVHPTDNEWDPVSRPAFNFEQWQYRVKRVPREAYVVWTSDGSRITRAFSDQSSAEEFARGIGSVHVVLLREPE